MRTYSRKTNRASATAEQLREAANSVLNDGKSVRSAAIQFEIKRMTLTRYIRKLQSQNEAPVMGYKTPRKVFTIEQENALKDYLLKMSAIFYGLSPKDVRHLAYQCAVKYNIKIPQTWTTNKMAGKEWLTMFLKRNRALSIRKPEPTSLGRATSFNKSNVKNFFEKLGAVLDKYKFTCSRIWNVDETGVSTVLKPNKIVAAKGKRNIGAMTSAERGTNVTMVTAISAAGNTVPPMFVFPRKNYKDYFINGGPPDCVGKGNASGWVTDIEFYSFIEHFIKHVKPSKEQPILLVLDNHSSHLHIKTIELAKNNGIIMLSFPPHCSHRLQPLDVSVFGPFKRYMGTAQDAWLRSNPARTMTIYDIPKLVAEALPLAATAKNIISGFQKTGIYPFDENIFTEDDFAPSYVTDRPQPTPEVQTPQQGPETQPSSSIENVNQTPNIYENPVPSTSGANISFSPEIIMPFPKAGPRGEVQKGRKKRKAAILTDTPEKNALAEEQALKETKNSQKKNQPRIDKERRKRAKKKVCLSSSSDESEKLTVKEKTKQKIEKRNKKKISKKRLECSSSDEDEYNCLICCEAYSDSLPGEDWIQCQICKNWAHIKCAPNTSFTYVCLNCDSDQD